MEAKARFVDASRTLDGNIRLTFQLVQQTLPDLDSIRDEDLMLTADKWRDKRSRDANAYFHVLAHKIAQKLDPPISDANSKNFLIGRYGQPEMTDDKVGVYIKTNIQPEEMQEQEYLHCRPVKAGDNGSVIYRVYRGSHTYDTKEMSVLIDGTVQEAKNLGIETMPPEEVERLVKTWRPRDGR